MIDYTARKILYRCSDKDQPASYFFDKLRVDITNNIIENTTTVMNAKKMSK